MNLQFYFEKLKSSEEYKKFISENSDAYFCSGFFVRNKTGNEVENKTHLDFYVPSSKKIFSFQLENGVRLVPANIPVEVIEKKIPVKIPNNCKCDFNEIEKLIALEMEKQEINNKIQKMLFSLQAKKEECFLIGTLFISNLGMIKIQINLDKMDLVEFKKQSFFDMLKVVKGKRGENNDKQDKKE